MLIFHKFHCCFFTSRNIWKYSFHLKSGFEKVSKTVGEQVACLTIQNIIRLIITCKFYLTKLCCKLSWTLYSIIIYAFYPPTCFSFRVLKTDESRVDMKCQERIKVVLLFNIQGQLFSKRCILIKSISSSRWVCFHPEL